MLQFNKTDTSIQLILTLTENVSMNNPIYVFTFTHVITKSIVSFTKTTADDESNFTERYNAFTIDTNLFTYTGEYHYVITEQSTGNILEKGKLQILEDFNYTIYNGTTSFQVYKG